MQCPLCKTEAVITSSKMVYSAAEGKLYRVIKYSCRNKKCNNYLKVVGEERNPVKFEIELDANSGE